MRAPALLRLIERFRRDESGNFAMTFAMIAIVIIATSGSAVDFTQLQQARTRAQTALDAAALALEPTIYTATPADLQSQAQALMLSELVTAGSNWSDCDADGAVAPCVHVATPTPDTVNGQLALDATLKVPMDFVRLVGVPEITASLASAATRKKLNLEVAMVLDNSGSMSTSFGSGTRMSVLQTSADCAANILFYGVSTCSAGITGLTANPDVKIGVVPFTMEVNIGPGNANADWIDRTGTGSDSITADNFDSDDYDGDTFAGPVDRIGLFGQISYKGSPLAWGGCVEARKHPYDVDDTAPDSSTPDTLFTPLFAPDEPGPPTKAGAGYTTNTPTYASKDTFYNSYIADTSSSCNREPVVVYTEVKTQCSSSATSARSFGNLSCTGTTTDIYTETDQTGATSIVQALPNAIFNNPQPSTYVETYSNKEANGSYSNTRTRTYTYVFSNREYQERLCKYTGATMSYAPSVTQAYGPNSDCPSSPVSPLSNSPDTVEGAIDGMAAEGGTNITEGAAWGWRVLSPGEPFTEGAAYGQGISKVMILMTDGENTAYQYGNMNDSEFYSAYGSPWNSTEHGRPDNTRLKSPSAGNSDLEGEMNSRLSTVCTNAKAQNITIYTIGIATDQTSDPTGNQALLTNCASTPSDAYFPSSASELANTFASIANQLSALRLTE